MAAEVPVSYEVRDEVAVITLRRPDKLNAVNRAVRDGITEAFQRFEADDSAKVAILAAEGKAFCAGSARNR